MLIPLFFDQTQRGSSASLNVADNGVGILRVWNLQKAGSNE
jgi:hypothetical protein